MERPFLKRIWITFKTTLNVGFLRNIAIGYIDKGGKCRYNSRMTITTYRGYIIDHNPKGGCTDWEWTRIDFELEDDASEHVGLSHTEQAAKAAIDFDILQTENFIIGAIWND